MENLDATRTSEILRNSTPYREFQAEREEILKHKWLESEKAGYDIGFERALIDWIIKHRKRWRREREKQSFLEQIQKKGVNIEVFSDSVEFSCASALAPAEYESREGLAGIAGFYECSPSHTLKRASAPLISPILGGVFANEYQNADKNYCIHFHEGLELTVASDQESLKIVNVKKE